MFRASSRGKWSISVMTETSQIRPPTSHLSHISCKSTYTSSRLVNTMRPTAVCSIITKIMNKKRHVTTKPLFFSSFCPLSLYFLFSTFLYSLLLVSFFLPFPLFIFVYFCILEVSFSNGGPVSYVSSLSVKWASCGMPYITFYRADAKDSILYGIGP